MKWLDVSTMHSGAFSEDGAADNLDDVFRISVGLVSLKHKTSNKLWRGEPNWGQTHFQTWKTPTWMKKQVGFVFSFLRRTKTEPASFVEIQTRNEHVRQRETCKNELQRWESNLLFWFTCWTCAVFSCTGELSSQLVLN